MKRRLLGLHIVDKSKLKRAKPVINYIVPNCTFLPDEIERIKSVNLWNLCRRRRLPFRVLSWGYVFTAANLHGQRFSALFYGNDWHENT